MSYWETAHEHSMPPYIALALVSTQRALGEKFLLLTPRTVPDFIDASILGKDWGFEPLAFNLAEGIEAIIAKSDLIRMAFVHRHGGAWVDADSIFLRDPTSLLFPTGLSSKLHWYSECIFASRAGNKLLAQALEAGLAGGVHAWGNPGGIKDIVARRPGELVLIPPSVVDPGYRPLYNFGSCDVMRRVSCRLSRRRLVDGQAVPAHRT
ncbi:glycosyltransferase [Pseudomonas sp. GM55]|uniref:glycosyltransferase n=1 Tax=Pseudomonas sp. GM55 TaxID=1144333 RepID=UPI001EE656D2|nr:glycosyltransferase [Pseudomonas sp. GM55]